MKKLLILAMFILLTGCVRYYYPQTALEDGVYYAADDPAYVVHYGGYSGATYYPWASLDYFYLGFNPYPRYAYFYGFPRGFAYGYSPWHYPYGYYGFYSPLYMSYNHFPGYPAFRPYGGFCGTYTTCNGRDGRGSGRNRQRRLVGDTGNDQQNPGEETIDDALVVDSLVLPIGRYSGGGSGKGGAGYNPYASSGASSGAPGGSASRGMMIRSNEDVKIGKSRTQPTQTNPLINGLVIAAPSASRTPANQRGGVASPPAATSTSGSPSSRSPSQSNARNFSSAPRGGSSVNSGRSRSGFSSPSRGGMRSRGSSNRRKRD